MGGEVQPMALELIGGELVDTEMVLETRGPSNGGGGLTLAERLARIETAINRLDEHMNDRVARLELRVAILESLNPTRLVEEFRDVQRRLAISEQVQATLTGYRRWLVGTALAVAGLGLVVLTDFYTIHAR